MPPASPTTPDASTDLLGVHPAADASAEATEAMP